MKYFDLHCDSLTKCFNSHDCLNSNSNHISFDKARVFENWSQFFAVFIPDTFSDEYAETYFLNCTSYFKDQLSDSRVHAYLTVENCGFIRSADEVGLLKNKGVVATSLTWNADNKLACGCHTKNDTGLTQLGFDVLSQLKKSGILVDVSHASEKTFWDIAENSNLPFIASHSNCYEIRRSKRNLKNEQISCIIERGGLIGLTFCRSFLPLDRPLFEGIYENIEHIVSRGGENNVCIGSDFDGCFIPQCIDSIEKVVDLYDFLRYRGIKTERLDKIFFDNAQNFANKYLQ